MNNIKLRIRYYFWYLIAIIKRPFCKHKEWNRTTVFPGEEIYYTCVNCRKYSNKPQGIWKDE